MRSRKPSALLSLLAIIALAMPGLAVAQVAGTIQFAANTTTGDGSVVPVLTWSTTPAATSCTASGDWSGAKGPAGTETLPAITTGKTYNLSCSWTDDRATLAWTAPTTNTDGSPLTDLAGFRIFYGTSAANLSQQVTISDPAARSRVISPLAPATWHFAMAAFNARNVESPRTATLSKVTGSASDTRSVGITVNPQPNPPTNLTVQ